MHDFIAALPDGYDTHVDPNTARRIVEPLGRLLAGRTTIPAADPAPAIESHTPRDPYYSPCDSYSPYDPYSPYPEYAYDGYAS